MEVDADWRWRAKACTFVFQGSDYWGVQKIGEQSEVRKMFWEAFGDVDQLFWQAHEKADQPSDG